MNYFLWTRQQQLIMSFNGRKLQDIESTLFEYFKSKIIFTNHIFPHDISKNRSVRAASTIPVISIFWGMRAVLLLSVSSVIA